MESFQVNMYSSNILCVGFKEFMPWLVWLSELSAGLHRPANQRVTGSIPSQGTSLGCRPGLQDGACKHSQMGTQPTEPHQPGPNILLNGCIIFLHMEISEVIHYFTNGRLLFPAFCNRKQCCNKYACTVCICFASILIGYQSSRIVGSFY